MGTTFSAGLNSLNAIGLAHQPNGESVHLATRCIVYGKVFGRIEKGAAQLLLWVRANGMTHNRKTVYRVCHSKCLVLSHLIDPIESDKVKRNMTIH
jgi:hypothetical protein